MNEEKDVPFSAYESVQARAEERFKKMWITIIILILLLVGSNFGWLIYESQYQDVVTTTQTVSQNTSEGGAYLESHRYVSPEYQSEYDGESQRRRRDSMGRYM